MRNLIYTLVFICPLLMTAQSSKDASQSIKQSITNYFEGYIERDINKLNKAFDLEFGTMKTPVKGDDGRTYIKNRYFKELMPKWGNREKMSDKALANCKLDILSMDILDDQVATSKISMKVDTTTYIDVLTLHKINGEWKITNKAYIVAQQ